MNELFNQSVPLKYIIKNKIIQLEDELSAVQSFEKRIAITEKFLLTQIQKNQKKLHYERIKHIIGMINQTKGIVDIDLLASESCLSRKQFERSFSDIIGASPKQFLRIIRFQNAIYQKSKYPRLNLTEIAHKCGYYDQAHMVNDFKTLSGFTPGQFFSDCEPFSDYFN
jgi:AraC-like DNA-binding protein